MYVYVCECAYVYVCVHVCMCNKSLSNIPSYPIGVESTKTLRFRAEKLVENFKQFKCHMARVVQQELHWNHALKEMKSKKDYNMVSPTPPSTYLSTI